MSQQKTSVLLQQQTCVLSQQQTSVLSQQKTSVLSQHQTSGALGPSWRDENDFEIVMNMKMNIADDDDGDDGDDHNESGDEDGDGSNYYDREDNVMSRMMLLHADDDNGC